MNDDARLSRPNTARGWTQRLVLQSSSSTKRPASSQPATGSFSTRWKPRVWSASRPGGVPPRQRRRREQEVTDAPIWLRVESRSLGGVLRAMTGEYRCSIAATNGQVGGFLHTEAASILQRNDRVVLHFGDFRPPRATRSRRTRVVFWNTRRVGGSTGTGLRSPKSRLPNVA
jgi:hypothetical protein